MFEGWELCLSRLLSAVVCSVWQVRLVFPQAGLRLSRRNDLTTQIQIRAGSKSTAGHICPTGLWQVHYSRGTTKTCNIIMMNRTFNVTNYIKTQVKVYRRIKCTKASLKCFLGQTSLYLGTWQPFVSPLCSQWEEVSGLDEENNSVRTYQICQLTDSSSSHWLRSGFIQRQGASQVYVELRFTMMECSSRSTHHRSCKETFNLYYYQADSNDATTTHPPWMENPYTKVHPHTPPDVIRT